MRRMSDGGFFVSIISYNDKKKKEKITWNSGDVINYRKISLYG